MIWQAAIEENLLHIYGVPFYVNSKLLILLKPKAFWLFRKDGFRKNFWMVSMGQTLMIDYERQSITSETMVYIASIGKMLRRYK